MNTKPPAPTLFGSLDRPRATDSVTDRALDLDRCPPVLRVAEAAAVTVMSPDSIRRAIRRGELRALRSGRVIRVHREALRRWLLGELVDLEAG